jgi:regulator of sigma E protease
MLELLWSVLGFVVAISILVCFHEFGHYWMARRMGVKVLRFSLGWGAPVWRRMDREGVEWALGPWPIGGYVKMLDEREGPVAAHERGQAFNNQSVPKRLAILFAGPAFNFILAFGLYWAMFLVGVPGLKPVMAEPPPASAAARAGLHSGDLVLSIQGKALATWTELRTELIDRALDGGRLDLRVRDGQGGERSATLDLSGVRPDPQYLFDDLGLDSFQPSLPAVIDRIESGTPAAQAGLRSGDRIVRFDGAEVADWAQLVKSVRERPGQVATLEIERAGERQAVNVVLSRSEEGGRAVGRLGAGVAMPQDLWQDLRAERRLGPVAAVPAAVGQTWQMTQLTLRMLWRMVLGDVSVKNVSGPIQIAQVAGYSAQIGLISFLSFMAVVSVSLGVLNLLPVPLLDGGHMLLYAIEGLKGKPLSERVQAAAQYVGLGFIGMLMVLALYNDIMRLI